MPQTYHIVLLPGDGIGPEVTAEAVRTLEAAAGRFGFGLRFEELPAGGRAIDETGEPMPERVLDACRAADAVFLGAVGGPKWDHLAGDRRPEAGLLRLRAGLGVFANLRPTVVPDALADTSPLRPERIRGTDLLVVRELTGGIYFGKPAGRSGEGAAEEAFNTMRYSAAEVERVARVAFEWARRRRGHVTSVDKANVLEVSRLWREVVTRLRDAEFPDVTLAHLYVDNASMQLVLNPRQFDVVLTGNLFGDILSDEAAALGGSLGLLPSASLGGRVGLFEPVHGSAPDLAGQGRANPLAAILSGAMMLDFLGLAEAAGEIRRSVDAVLAGPARTGDLWREGLRLVGTSEMGALVRESLAARPHPLPA